MDYKKGDVVKIGGEKIVKIINLPGAFMSNGSYEVIQWVDNGLGEIGKPFWVKPEKIMYPIKKEMLDDINHYFEVIWDEDGLNLIPKDFSSINIESDRDDFNRIKFTFEEGRKHKTVNIHVGGVSINDKDKITTRPKKKKKSKVEKIINVLKEKEDEV
jgi:hypothetical protein